MNLAMASGIAVGAAALAWFYPTIWLSRAARERTDRITKDLPYAIDLLTVAMEAGQDFGAALRYLTNEGPRGALNDEFSVLLHQTELGKSRVEALRALAERVRLEEMDQLVSAVVQSTETGGSVVGTLKVQAEDIRRRRFHRAERKAARAPSIMMIPVALFILPAVFIIIFTPVGIRMSESMRAME
jgi:tight adherence protein C